MAKSVKHIGNFAEYGFVLPEVLVLAFFVMTMAGSLILFQTSVKAKGDAIFRLTAMYLARTELAHIEELAQRDNFYDGQEFSWLGKLDDLSANGGNFTVTGKVKLYESGVFLASVAVTWPYFGRERLVTVEKIVVCRHD